MNARGIQALFCGLIVASACTTANDIPEELVSVDWQMSTIGRPDGKVYEIDPPKDRFIIFDGNGSVITEGCNRTGRPVRIDAEQLSFGEGSSTLVRCRGRPGTLDALVNRLLSDEAIWEITRDKLRIRGSGVLATFRPPDSQRPKSGIDHVLIEENNPGGPQFRMGWYETDAGVFVGVQGRLGPGRRWRGGDGGMMLTPYAELDKKLFPMTSKFGDRLLAFGELEISVSRVEFRPSNGGAVEMDVYDLPHGTKLFAGLLDAKERGPIVALSEDGTEVARSRPLPDPTPVPDSEVS